MHGSHALGHWSRTQQTVALSSAEAELNGLCKAAAEGLGVRNMTAEFLTPIALELHTDASAAKGVVARQGAGRIKHLEVRQLWVQEKERSGDLSVKKIPRKENSADLFTHHVSEPSLCEVLSNLNIVRRGPPFAAPARGGQGRRA